MEEEKIPDSEASPTLPEHLILGNILPRVPVKSLARFKCVSTHWLSTISTPEFAETHLKLFHPTFQFITFDPHELQFSLLTFKCNPDEPIHNVTQVVPMDFNVATASVKIVGSCRGLVCMYFQHDRNFIVWNPATRVCRDVPSPDGVPFADAFGFGYSPSLDDYKIAIFCGSAIVEDLIRYIFANSNAGNINDDNLNEFINNAMASVNGEVGKTCFYVYSLGKDEWRRVPCPNDDFLALNGAAVVIDEDFYWTKNLGISHPIVRFDLVSEQLERKIMKPRLGWRSGYRGADLFQMQGCLALRCTKKIDDSSEIWILSNQDDWSTWNKFFSVNVKGNIYFSEIGKWLVQCADHFKLANLVPEALEDTFKDIDADYSPLEAREYEESLISPFEVTKLNEEEHHEG